MWRYYLLLFLSSGCIMTLELLAGRLLAPYIGVSLYTWTGIIGACLTGMSIGSLFGGWLADKADPRRLLSGMLLVGAGLVAGFLLFHPFISSVAEAVRMLGLNPLLGIFFLSMLLFGVPCFFMAAVSPVAYKLALKDPSKVGSTVGRLSASGIAGSIAGTYATGFWLVPTFGTQAIVMGVAVVLGMLGVAALPWTRSRQVVAGVLVGVLPWVGLQAAPTLANNPCKVESAYYCIRWSLKLDSTGERVVKQLSLDSLIHSGYRVDKPDELWYEYEQVAAWVMDAELDRFARTLFLGGGGYILPYWVERNFPDATVDVIEIDPAVTRVALQEFVPDSRRIKSHNLDARQAMIQFPETRKYNLVFSDVFNDFSVPYHLTTREFHSLVRQHLAEGGLYIMNVVDSNLGPFVGAVAATLQEVFPHVVVLPGSDATGSSRTPQLLVASDRPLPLEEWAKHPLKPRFSVEPLELDGPSVILTDNHAPTDMLLLPIFRERWMARN